jgi:hypothetical protein
MRLKTAKGNDRREDAPDNRFAIPQVLVGGLRYAELEEHPKASSMLLRLSCSVLTRRWNCR